MILIKNKLNIWTLGAIVFSFLALTGSTVCLASPMPNPYRIFFNNNTKVDHIAHVVKVSHECIDYDLTTDLSHNSEKSITFYGTNCPPNTYIIFRLEEKGTFGYTVPHTDLKFSLDKSRFAESSGDATCIGNNVIGKNSVIISKPCGKD